MPNIEAHECKARVNSQIRNALALELDKTTHGRNVAKGLDDCSTSMKSARSLIPVWPGRNPAIRSPQYKNRSLICIYTRSQHSRASLCTTRNTNLQRAHDSSPSARRVCRRQPQVNRFQDVPYCSASARSSFVQPARLRLLPCRVRLCRPENM